MYRLGHRPRLYKRYLAAAIGCLLIAILSCILIVRLPAPARSTTSNSPSVTTRIDVGSPSRTHIDTAVFSLGLPPAWKPIGNGVDGPYSYRGTTSDDANRLIEIYFDATPSGRAVNRLVALKSMGDSVSHGAVSDNCVDFTSQAAQAAPEAQRTKTVLSTWQNVAFICDIGNYGRNVVGASAVGPLNSVNLQGKKGQHSVFFVYTDQNFTPDYGIFYSMLESFTVK